MLRWIVVCGLAAVLPHALAGGPEIWEVDGPALAEAEADGVMVSPDGVASLAARTRRVVEPDESTLWSLAVAADGAIAAGGGESGRVHFVAPDGTATVLHEAGEGEVFAVAFDREGRVLAAVSPGGPVLRLPPDGGEATPLFDPGEEYVWDLLVEPDGGLLVATGVPGRVYRVRGPDRPPELVYDPGRDHVRAMAFDRDGQLLVGTAGRATVARVGESGGFVLHDAGEGEVTDLAVDPADGAVWVSLALPAAPPAPAPKTEGGKSGSAKKAVAKDPPKKTTTTGGAVLRIEPDGLVREVLRSTSQTPLSLLATEPARVLVGTADDGRVLLLDASGRTGLRLDTSSRQVSALAAADGRMAVALSNVAALLVTEAESRESGTLLSPVHDAGRPARWGRLRVDGQRPRGSGLGLELRAGNTAEPDGGWTSWIPVEGDVLGADGAASALPSARFVQWRLLLEGTSRARPRARAVAVHYRPANRPPEIKSLSLEPAGLAYRALPPPKVSSGERPVLADPLPPDVKRKLVANAGGKSRSKKAYEPGARTAIWEASDPDGDRLVFDVFVAHAGDDEWRVLGEQLEGTFHAFDTRALPDGRYRLRLVARDDPDNDGSSARRGERTTGLFLVDNRPPEVVGARARREGNGLVVTFRGRDTTAPVVRGEVSLAGGPWLGALPEDGIGDSREESFRIRVPLAGEAPASVVVRVMDEAGNLVAAVVPVPEE